LSLQGLGQAQHKKHWLQNACLILKLVPRLHCSEESA
jgi:hypothetical protein